MKKISENIIEGKMYLWNADIKIVNIDSNLFVVIGGDYIHGMYIGEDHIEKLELTKQKMLKVLKDNNSDFVIGR